MLISKFLSAACLVALGASLASLQAEDNPAQAAARKLLMEQADQPLTAPVDSVVSVTPGTPVNFEVGSDGSVHMLQAAAPVKPAAKTVVTLNLEVGSDGSVNVLQPAAPVKSATKPAATLTPTKPAPQASVDMIPALTLTKAQRLSALLAKYKADQITPEQYHMLRAKVLSEP